MLSTGPKHVETVKDTPKLRCLLLTALAAMLVGCSPARKPERSQPTPAQPTEASAPGAELKLTDANFEAQTRNGVVLVDFWATWCPPCRMQGPIIERVARAAAGKAKVGKCNVDAAPATARRFQVRNIPTLIILKDGKEVERLVGVQQEALLLARLNEHIQ